MFKKIFFVLSTFVFINLLTCNYSDNIAKKMEALDLENLQKAIDELENDPVMQNGTWAFSLREAESGKILMEHHAQKTLNIASCMKAVTTTVALDILGADYQFKTVLEHDGVIQNGVLNGNLYIKGYGDPTLGSEIIAGLNLNMLLSFWYQKLREAGIQKINGAIIADEELFDENTVPAGWLWEDIGNYYGAPAGALNVFDNTYKLFFQPGAEVGKPATIIRTEPYIGNINFVNQVKTGEALSGDQCVIFGAPYDEQRYCSGTVPIGGPFSVKGSIPDPAMLLLSNFSEFLKKNGIEIMEKNASIRLLKKEKKTIPTGERKILYTHLSPNLKEIVNFINFYSVNLFAEATLKAMGVAKEKRGNTISGLKTVIQYWKDKGLNTQGFYMKDGSGLSLSNGITANQLTEMFSITSKLPHFQNFYQSLPIAGVSGTMQGICVGSNVVGNLRAKTGGMTRVIAFTGYFTAKTGQLMSFAVMANQYNCDYKTIQKKLEKIMIKMAD